MKLQRILVVDDEAHIRRLIAFSLKRGGYERLIFATNGLEALGVAEEEKPDLIVMDFVMPELDGLGALAQLKSDTRTENIPVIIVSGCGEFHANLDPKAMGATDVLTKPYSPSSLLDSVNRALREPTEPTRRAA